MNLLSFLIQFGDLLNKCAGLISALTGVEQLRINKQMQKQQQSDQAEILSGIKSAVEELVANQIKQASRNLTPPEGLITSQPVNKLPTTPQFHSPVTPFRSQSHQPRFAGEGQQFGIMPGSQPRLAGKYHSKLQ